MLVFKNMRTSKNIMKHYNTSNVISYLEEAILVILNRITKIMV
jgi:hypothetical protein